MGFGVSPAFSTKSRKTISRTALFWAQGPGVFTGVHWPSWGCQKTHHEHRNSTLTARKSWASWLSMPPNKRLDQILLRLFSSLIYLPSTPMGPFKSPLQTLPDAEKACIGSAHLAGFPGVVWSDLLLSCWGSRCWNLGIFRSWQLDVIHKVDLWLWFVHDLYST